MIELLKHEYCDSCIDAEMEILESEMSMMRCFPVKNVTIKCKHYNLCGRIEKYLKGEKEND